MIEMTDLLDDLMDQSARRILARPRSSGYLEPHACDGCGETREDVDLFAEDSASDQTLWLCQTCGEA